MDAGGQAVRNATYLCWHTGDWTPAAAIAECDPDLVAKPPVARTTDPTTISAEALFDSDKWTLNASGRHTLDVLAQRIADGEIESIASVGLTDSLGGAAHNRKLSIRRAEAVKSYLIGRGVSPERITALGRGEADPVTDGTPDGRARKRRVEIEFAGVRR